MPFRPGTTYQYSSGDYFLLGQIVKRVSGQSLAEFARQRIFEPLGMQRTFSKKTRPASATPCGWTLEARDGHWSIWKSTTYWPGGGGLYTSVEDLHRWDQAFANNRLPAGRYLNELFQEGSLLDNRNCLDVDAARKESDPDARRASPPGQYRGLKRRQFTGGRGG